jgi:hypothetical protein
LIFVTAYAVAADAYVYVCKCRIQHTAYAIAAYSRLIFAYVYVCVAADAYVYVCLSC